METLFESLIVAVDFSPLVRTESMHPLPTESESNRVFSELSAGLHRAIKKKCPSTPHDLIDDAVQFGLLKLWERLIQSDPTAKPVNKLFGFAFQCAYHELLRLLSRKPDAQLLDQSPAPAALDVVLDHETRRRQSDGLSLAFVEFVDHCENDKAKDFRGLRIKECYERYLAAITQGCADDRGLARQGYEDIIDAMSRRYRQGNSNSAYRTCRRDIAYAELKILELRNSHDPHGSIFTDNILKKQQARLSGVAENADSSALDELTADLPEESPLLEKSLINTQLLLNELPDVQRSRQIYFLLINFTRAYCPSEKRLAAFASWLPSRREPVKFYRNCSTQDDDRPEDLLDVWYHAIERGCKYCALRL